jgi:hypothetical protein
LDTGQKEKLNILFYFGGPTGTLYTNLTISLDFVIFANSGFLVGFFFRKIIEFVNFFFEVLNFGPEKKG